MRKGMINFSHFTIFGFLRFDFVRYKQQRNISAYFPIFTSPLTYIWIEYFGVVKVWSWGKYKTTIIYSCYHRKYLIATFSPPCSAWRESPRSGPRGEEDSSFWSRRWFSVCRGDQDCGPRLETGVWTKGTTAPSSNLWTPAPCSLDNQQWRHFSDKIGPWGSLSRVY